MGSEGDGPVAAELLPGFAVLVDGNDYGVFPPRGDRASLPAPLDAQHSLQKRLGHLPQRMVRHCVHAGGHLDLDSRQGSFEFGESQRGVNCQTVVGLRVWVVGLHFTTALAHQCPQGDCRSHSPRRRLRRTRSPWPGPCCSRCHPAVSRTRGQRLALSSFRSSSTLHPGPVCRSTRNLQKTSSGPSWPEQEFCCSFGWPLSFSRASPRSGFCNKSLLAVLIPPGVSVRAWSASAGGGDSYPCRCQNGGDYLTVDLLDVGLAYVDILGSQHTPKQVPVRLVVVIFVYRSRTPYLSCTVHIDDDGQVVRGEWVLSHLSAHPVSNIRRSMAVWPWSDRSGILVNDPSFSTMKLLSLIWPVSVGLEYSKPFSQLLSQTLKSPVTKHLLPPPTSLSHWKVVHLAGV